MISSVEGKLEVSLAGLVFLALATLVASGIVFLFGVYVGKGVAEQRFVEEQRVVRLPVTAAAPAAKAGEAEPTIWENLSRGEGGAASAAPAPTATEAPIHVPAPEAKPPTLAPTPTAAATPTAVPVRPAPPAPVPPPLAKGMRYQVQVNAMAEKVRAEQLVRDLKASGFNAYISPGTVSGRTLYRVRIGKYPTEEAARQTIVRLREQGFPKAFLAAE